MAYSFGTLAVGGMVRPHLPPGTKGATGDRYGSV